MNARIIGSEQPLYDARGYILYRCETCDKYIYSLCTSCLGCGCWQPYSFNEIISGILINRGHPCSEGIKITCDECEEWLRETFPELFD